MTNMYASQRSKFFDFIKHDAGTCFSGFFDEIGNFEYDSSKDDDLIKEKQNEENAILNLIRSVDSSTNINNNTSNNNINSICQKFAWIIIDSIGISITKNENNENVNNLINSDYYWKLSNSDTIFNNQINKDIESSIPSVLINNLMHGDNNNINNNNNNNGNSNDACVRTIDVDSDTESIVSNASDNDNSNNNNIDWFDCFAKYIDNICNDSCHNTDNSKNNKNNTTTNNNDNGNKNNYLVSGFINNVKYKRGIIDAIKCHVGIENLKSFINFDFSNNIYNFELTISNLIILLLEISHPNIHKNIISSAIAQNIPIPIIYPMCKITACRVVSNDKNIDKHNDNNSKNKPDNDSNRKLEMKDSNVDNNETTFSIDYYLRDILDLASKSKLINDVKSQINSKRNQPLIMFIGSDLVNGKSTMLSTIYPKYKNFNVNNSHDNINNKTPLHSSSVDLIFLDQFDCNYHILDVHGNINDPLFKHCSCGNNEINDSGGIDRIDSLVYLASYCHCVVIQIHQSQLTSIINQNNHSNDILSLKSIKSLISNKKGKAIRQFVGKLNVSNFFFFFA